jgi:SAM-dependent methyltransferase
MRAFRTESGLARLEEQVGGAAMTQGFDEYADSYGDEVTHSIAFAKTERDFFTRRKANCLLDLSRRLLGDPAHLSVVDVGCGVGSTDAHLAGRFRELHGVDTAPETIRRAAANNPSVRYQSYDGRSLPFPDSGVDLAFAINVVHHVPRIERLAFAQELRRVVRQDGLVVVFEQNPLNPLTRLAISRCDFDKGVVLLTRRALARLLSDAGLDPVEQRYIIFSTSDRPRVRALEGSLGWLPLGAQHYVAARR